MTQSEAMGRDIVLGQSQPVALSINKTLRMREGPIKPFHWTADQHASCLLQESPSCMHAKGLLLPCIRFSRVRRGLDRPGCLSFGCAWGWTASSETGVKLDAGSGQQSSDLWIVVYSSSSRAAFLLYSAFMQVGSLMTSSTFLSDPECQS